MRFIKLFTLVLTVFLAGCAASEDKTVYQSVEDIRTARIGLVLGTTHDAYVAANFKDAQIIKEDMLMVDIVHITMSLEN
jgi:ABC-type amino acid transport substrate-binding protein